MKLNEININLPKQGEYISQRVDNYLRNIGGNSTLADGLQKQERYWIGPFLLPLELLKRCCGPEKLMEYLESQENFDSSVNRIIEYFNSGEPMDSLICQFKEGKISIRDGNHRYEALKKLEIDMYRTLVWTDSTSEYNECMEYIQDNISEVLKES